MTNWLDTLPTPVPAPKRSGYRVIREAMEWLRTTDAVSDGTPYSARALRVTFDRNHVFGEGEATSTTMLSICKKACAAGWMTSNGKTSQAANYTLNRMPKEVAPSPTGSPLDSSQPAWAVRLEAKIDRLMKNLEVLR